jgi:CBS domain-containing protein
VVVGPPGLRNKEGEMNEPVKKLLEEKSGALEAVGPRSTVLEAITLMNKRRMGSVLVMEGDRLVGIFTERDVLTRVVPQHLDPRRTPVGEVMSRQPITISPNRSVQEAMILMTDSHHRHLPVVQGGKVVGLLSIGDLTRWMVRDQQRTIDDLTDYVRRV